MQTATPSPQVCYLISLIFLLPSYFTSLRCVFKSHCFHFFSNTLLPPFHLEIWALFLQHYNETVAFKSTKISLLGNRMAMSPTSFSWPSQMHLTFSRLPRQEFWIKGLHSKADNMNQFVPFIKGIYFNYLLCQHIWHLMKEQWVFGKFFEIIQLIYQRYLIEVFQI